MLYYGRGVPLYIDRSYWHWDSHIGQRAQFPWGQYGYPSDNMT